jgi:LysM repeat protein
MFGRVLIFVAVTLALWLAFAHGSSGAGHRQTVVVRAGDTLWSIASTHYAGDPREGVWKLERRNHLQGVMLSPGQRLVLP